MPGTNTTHANPDAKTGEGVAGRHPSHTGGARSYERHQPEETVLYKTLQVHWNTFLRELESAAEPPVLPAFVISEVEAYLRCGILAHGFVLAKCGDCGWCRPVGLSCKRRGFCPSCIGRRMCDFAAGLVDRVIPHVPVRQWVLTVPHGLRAKMAFDPALTSVVLRQFIAAVSSWLRRRARRVGVRGALKAGAVTVIQRFNSAIDVSVHYHALFLDGVYRFPPGGKPVFHPTPSPTDEDVARVAAAVFRRVERALADREPDAAQRRFVESAPILAAVAEASVRGVVATGPRRGRRIIRIRGAPGEVDAFVMGKLCAQVEGYNVQAATRVPANDREGLERMARYLARPPVATGRLSQLDDGRLELRLKRAWRDGTTSFVFTPHEIIERLIAIVPRPRAHLTRYFGGFAPAFGARSGIVPAKDATILPGRRSQAASDGRAETAVSIPVGVTNLASVRERRLGVRTVQRPDGDRRRGDVDRRDHANPGKSWAADRPPHLSYGSPAAPDAVAVRRCRIRSRPTRPRRFGA